MPSLSVIIPFYKDFAYIEQAVHSVLAEPVDDVEIIIVNDNPGDGTTAFLTGLDFPDRVRIVTHDANRGLSAARNTGVEEARGDWIAYLDGDDYFLAGGLAHQFAAARRTGADITHATTILRERTESGWPLETMVSRDAQFFNRDAGRVDLESTPELQFIISSWKSIYRRDHLIGNHIRFDEAQRKFEDRLYVLENVFSGAHVALVAKPARVWRRRQGSITTSEKSRADRVMMANLVDKCTGLAGELVNRGTLDRIHLDREIFHSTARLVWDTGLLDAALAESEADKEGGLRDILARAIGRARLDGSIFADSVVRAIDRTHTHNPAGVAMKQNAFVDIQQAIAAGDWRIAGQIWQAAGANGKPASARPAIRGPRPGAAHADVELVVHIGLHKTGTTFLQRQFAANRETLRDKGWLFPETGFFDHGAQNIRDAATPGHQGLLHAAVDADGAVRRAFQSEVRKSGCKHVLVSCENMSQPYLSSDLRFEKVAAVDRFFADFPNRRVVALFRRPDAYMEALYRERVTNPELRECRSARHFCESHADAALDFASMLAPWLAFAGGRLELQSYDELRADGRYVAAFCDRLGFAFDPAKKKRTYGSPPREAIETVRLLHALMPAGPRKAALLRIVLESGARDERGRDPSALSPDYRMELVRKSEASSDLFLKAHGLCLPFAGMLAEIEAEAGSWPPLSGPEFTHVQALVNAAGTMTAGFSEPGDGAVRDMLTSSFARSGLLNVYNVLPGFARRWARSAYRRVVR